MVQGASKLDMNPPKPAQPEAGIARRVVYLPSCVTRMMGPALSDTQKASVHEKLLSVFNKAGYEVIYPEVRHIPGSSPWPSWTAPIYVTTSDCSALGEAATGHVGVTSAACTLICDCVPGTHLGEFMQIGHLT